MQNVNVVFFASLKERMGIASYEAQLNLPVTVEELKHKLSKELNNGGSLLESGIQSSIDFEFSRDTDVIPENVKEVAFFPPVTGG
ncbi:MoaD/ThiS family protein [Marinomonas sp. C2222]|uniref:MoaD/ThiS family protein n=1 Tax=Marinomonas sargassi TaxID=2984494 RepID=A0ABT2YSF8_9GAMM|nr:MoaD/ThiS family protein [Marinomonas sargassi]MCV2402816.1 MoaD/ThiS family protein [Marinomonas sargassi]